MPLKCTRTFLGVALLASVISIALGHHAGLSDGAVAKVKEEFGATAEQRLYSWQSLIHDHMDENDQAKLEAVNDFFNRARFVDDIKLWRQKDYWATPVEFLARNAGDCEDFSIAKFFTLKDMGMDTAKLRITYVKALRLNQAHMVLAYYPTPSSVPLILDNLTGRILPADQRTDLRPVYSFNAEDLWLSRSRNEQVKAGKASSLGRWMELNRRFNEENRPVKNTVLPSTAEKKSSNLTNASKESDAGITSVKFEPIRRHRQYAIFYPGVPVTNASRDEGDCSSAIFAVRSRFFFASRFVCKHQPRLNIVAVATGKAKQKATD